MKFGVLMEFDLLFPKLAKKIQNDVTLDVIFCHRPLYP